MSVAVILSACRTPIGKFQSTLGSMSAVELGATAIRAALGKAGVAPELVEEVTLGMVLSSGAGQAPARQAALHAEIPASVGALTINKVCGSGLKAVMLASLAIRCGDVAVAVAGGMESMSRAPWLVNRQLSGFGDKTLTDSLTHDGLRCAMNQRSMGELAERLAKQQGIGREEQDRYACQSHRRAVLAQRENLFDAEIASVTVKSKSGVLEISSDEGPRSDCSLETLTGLKPAFVADGTVTAGNAAMVSDGAAAVVMTSDDFARSRKLQPLVEIVAATTAGVEPEDLFLAPVEAIRKLLKMTGHSPQDVDLWEINEAFAVQVIANQRLLGIPDEVLNVHGGAIALGHPIGASGARVLTTLIHALRMRDRELGVAALCLGGGNAVAMLVKRLS
jgi:acetyl-CoA C-acetyltransferase